MGDAGVHSQAPPLDNYAVSFALPVCMFQNRLPGIATARALPSRSCSCAREAAARRKKKAES